MTHIHALTRLTLALALAFAGAAQAQSSDVNALDRVVITTTLGQGQLRSVQQLSQVEFANAVPGTSPLQTVSRLPGVNFQAADGLGNYEWSTRFTVRGFSQNQLGFTLDDVPLGDMTYGNLNGLHISRAISNENVGRAALSQGAGALETASSSNLGGTLQFYSTDPAKTFGARLSQTLGSDQDRRTFLRIDSGASELGQFYASYTHQDADKWKGAGQQRQRQWNFKWTKDIGDHHFSAFVNTSDRREIDYQDMSLEMINRLGVNWDNFYPDFGAAVKVAQQYLCATLASTPVQCDDAYYAGSGLRKDTLAGFTADLRLAPSLTLKSTIYSHHNQGRGLWYTPYTPSPDGTPVSLRTTEYAIKRAGLIMNAEYELGEHLIKAGLWHENNDFDQARRFYATPVNAVPSPYDFPSNPFFTQWQYAFTTKTDQFSLSDTWALTPDLSVGAGFKSLRVAIDGELQVGSGKPSGRITASKGFLPQLGINYRLSKTDELYGTLARNMRAYQGAATGTTPFATTAAGFAAIQTTLKPETADTLEAGWRTQGRGYQGAVSAYLIDFKDRQLGVTAGSGIQGNPTILANVGSVRTTGVEASLSLKLATGWSWYNSLSLSRSTYQDDVVSGGKTVAIAGKHVVDAPDTLFKSVLGYDDGALFGNLSLDSMSQRYFSYLNDAKVAGRQLFSLTGGYRLKGVAGLSELSLQGGVNNLTNKRYISTIGSNGFGNSGDNQTLLPGAPRQWFATLTGKF